MGEVPGFIIDLRIRATGGNEALARQLASAFCAHGVVYAKSQFRSGPKHSDFGPDHERRLPAGKQPFTRPVVVLLGSQVFSSGEGLAQMLAVLPHVTTVGSPTGGGSGNPRPLKVRNPGITVWFSSWVDRLPDGTIIENHGLVPQVEAMVPVGVFSGAKDPVLEKGLEVLEEKLRK